VNLLEVKGKKTQVQLVYILQLHIDQLPLLVWFQKSIFGSGAIFKQERNVALRITSFKVIENVIIPLLDQ